MHSPGDAYGVINDTIAPEALALFREKQANHTTGSHFLLLGAKGQFAEINKKFWKLYAAIWTGEIELIGEDVGEVAADMIGHLLLLLYCVRRDTPDSPLRNDRTNAHEGGSEDACNEMQVRSGPAALRPPEESGTPRRCGSCDDCLSVDPIWCWRWGAPNAYALTNMSNEQFERMRRMFPAHDLTIGLIR